MARATAGITAREMERLLRRWGCDLVRTKGGHTVYVQAKTTIESVSEDGKDTQFKVLVGRIRAFVQKLRPANKFEVRTPVAAAAVRGTIFDMDVAEDTSSRLSGLEGAVNYRDLAGLAKEIEVLKGQTVLMPAKVSHAVNAPARFKMLLTMVREVAAK